MKILGFIAQLNLQMLNETSRDKRAEKLGYGLAAFKQQLSRLY